LTKARILVVDDDPGQLELLSMRLSAAGFEVVSATSSEQALAAIHRGLPDVVIADLRIGKADDRALIESLSRDWPGLPLIILTAHGSIRDAVVATQQGVFSFLAKPVAPAELLATLERALEQRAPAEKMARGLQRIVTRNARMYQLLDQAQLVAQSEVNVLISGESGTGKELLARAIHHNSRRAAGPFTPVNCSAIPDHLLESELFGHRKGSFTGASRDHPGLFAASEGGTIFLDEIGDMPLSLQAKLLRVLQERKVRPVGETADRPVNVRVLSATHCDLDAAVEEGTFREDLYYRLNVVELALPGLRDRREDIPLLTQRFLREIAARQDQPAQQLSPDAVKELVNYDWPGNIRQLQNVVEQVVALSTSPVISDAQIRNALPRDHGGIAKLSEAKTQFEHDYLVRLLQMTGGNIADAARHAGRNRSDLYKVIKRHQIDLGRFQATRESSDSPSADGADTTSARRV
jgi:two-component system, NtrC family, response regulator GlrR